MLLGMYSSNHLRKLCTLYSLIAKRLFGFSGRLRSEMFLQRFSPTTGKMEWVTEDEEYDMRNEIARSSYADMLHDDERNKMYYQATKQVVKNLKASGEKIHMLDIGTGTGLLAMMAVRSGADGATACEAFEPIAKVAGEITKKNGFGDKISVIGKRSTELSLEEGNKTIILRDGNLQSRANLLVTELWDTELIGEGALPTLRDACRRLLEPGFISVPAAGTIYAQVVGSDALWSMHQLNPQQMLDNQDITLPVDMEDCRGTASGFDLHVDELSNDEIHIFTSPVPVVRFEFCSGSQSKNPHCTNRVSVPETKDRVDNDKTVSHHCVETSVTQTGSVHGVVMWWSLDMDMDGKIILTTAPRWVHPDGDKRQWRDHWMQAVYFLKTPLVMQEGDKINVHCYHDDYSIWFDVTPAKRILTTVDRPLCTCGAHVTWSRHRFAMLNDRQRSQAFSKALKQLVAEGYSRCLCISDGSLLPIMAAKLGFEKVITVESSVLFQKFLRKIMDLNGVADKVEILSQDESDLRVKDLSTVQVDAIFGEPFFTSGLFPWHNLYFWYAAASTARISKPTVKILPKGATLKAIAVEFDDLWKFHAPVNIVEGFDISLFDKLIEGSKLTNEEINCESSDGIALEPHHLWEYPSHALTKEFTLMEFDFTSNIPSQKMASEGEAKLTRPGTFHGVAIWMDFHLTDKLTVTTGLQPNQDGALEISKLNWVRHTKQGVYFVKLPTKIQDSTLANENASCISYDVSFEPCTGEIDFNFQLQIS